MSLNYHECSTECLRAYTISIYTLTCTATDFQCVCAIPGLAKRLFDTSKAGGCMIHSCEKQAQSFLVNEVADTCSKAQVHFTLDPENPLSEFVPTNPQIVTTSSRTPEATSAAVASTSAFVPTTVFTSTTTARAQTSLSDVLISMNGTETELPSSSAPVASSSLSPKGIGGIAAGASVAGLTAAACLIWFIIRRRKNSDSNNTKHDQNTTERSGEYDGQLQGGATNRQETCSEDVKVIYQHHNAIQELPGDDPPQSPMISELDSIRPVSELEYIAYNSDRVATTPGARVVSPILSNIAEVAEGKALSSPDDVVSPVQAHGDEALPNLPDNNHAAGQRTDETFLPAPPPTSS